MKETLFNRLTDRVIGELYNFAESATPNTDELGNSAKEDTPDTAHLHNRFYLVSLAARDSDLVAVREDAELHKAFAGWRQRYGRPGGITSVEVLRTGIAPDVERRLEVERRQYGIEEQETGEA